ALMYTNLEFKKKDSLGYFHFIPHFNTKGGLNWFKGGLKFYNDSSIMKIEFGGINAYKPVVYREIKTSLPAFQRVESIFYTRIFDPDDYRLVLGLNLYKNAYSTDSLKTRIWYVNDFAWYYSYEYDYDLGKNTSRIDQVSISQVNAWSSVAAEMSISGLINFNFLNTIYQSGVRNVI